MSDLYFRSKKISLYYSYLSKHFEYLKSMKDILSLFVSNEEASLFIKKTYRVTTVLLFCNLIYALLNLLDWYHYVQKIPNRSHSIHNYDYYYTIRPAITLLDILVIIVGSALNYQGYAQLVAALKKNDNSSLATGFKKFYRAYLIFLISTIALILDTVYRIYYIG